MLKIQLTEIQGATTFLSHKRNSLFLKQRTSFLENILKKKPDKPENDWADGSVEKW